MIKNNEALAIDLLVCGTVVTLDQDSRVIENGAVAVQDDCIVAVGPAVELERTCRPSARLELEHGLVMPGLVNVHTHAPMSCLRGIADDLPLMTWLQEYIFPVEAKLNSEIVYQATLLSIMEMIRSGTTCFSDMYLFAKDVARAVDQSGMRGWLSEPLYDFPSPNYGELAAGFDYVDELFDLYREHPLITIAAAPHSTYTCAPDLLVRLKEKAEQNQAIFHIHLSETREEVETIQQRFGLTPVRHLDKLGLLDSRMTAAHCVVLDVGEIELLARRGVKVAHCPESNMKLASGVAPVPQMLEAGLVVGLGTDGCASNNDVDLFTEMDTAAKLHKVHTLDPTVMSAEQTLSLTTMGGARLLGVEDQIGSLAPGKKADLIVLDLNQPHLTPLYHIPSHLVYAARGSDVVHSVINGKIVMKNRQFTTLDEKDILDKIREMTADFSS